MHINSIFLVVTLSAVLLVAPQAQSQTLLNFDVACESLNRPNVDCACVSERLGLFMNLAATEDVKTLVTERYMNSIGKENQLDMVLGIFNADRMALVTAELAYESVGGLPQNINDFEKGCAIPSAAQYQFDEVDVDSQAGLYLEAQVKSVGEAYRRSLYCTANLLDRYLSEQEFEAYRLSFSYYEGDHNSDDQANRAKKMNIKRSEFIRLEKSARSKISKNSTKDENYCYAMTNADNVSVVQNQKDKDYQTKQIKKLGLVPAVDVNTAKDDETKARNLMKNSCSKSGNSESYCQCLMSDFEANIVKKSPRPSVTLAWTVIHSAADIASDSLMQLMMQAKPEDQLDASMLLMTTSNVGEKCVQTDA